MEAEVQPGVWQVIEPQSQKGLEKTHTRFYYPTSRARYLEDQTLGMKDIYLSYFARNLLFKPGVGVAK